jgi:flagellar biosynthesis protein FlhF
MRFKTYQGKTAKEVMKVIRTDLGDQALIVSTEENNSVVTIVVAQENEMSESTPKNVSGHMDEVLRYHRTPASVIEYMKAHAPQNKTTLEDRLKDSLRSATDFPSFDEVLQVDRPVMLIGPPGVGKTLCLAKIAAQLIMDDKQVEIISTDRQKTGAFEQIDQIAETLGVPLHVIENPTLLHKSVLDRNKDTVLLIDTPGINPYIEEERNRLHGLVHACEAMVILVMPARGDHENCQDLEEAFKDFGTQYMILTQLDMSTRLGFVLTRCIESSYPVIATGQYSQVAHFLIPTISDRFIDLFTQSHDDDLRRIL